VRDKRGVYCSNYEEEGVTALRSRLDVTEELAKKVCRAVKMVLLTEPRQITT